MDQKYKDALNRLRVSLVQDLHPLYVAQALNLTELTKIIQANLYSQPHNQHESERKRTSYAEQILDILLQRENSAFFTFLDCLSNKCDQKHLSEDLRKHAVADDMVGLNLEELLASQNYQNNDRIRIADLKPSLKGCLQFQVIHRQVIKETAVGDIYSFLVADDTGGINIKAKGNNGKIVDKLIKKNGFYQISDWGIDRRKQLFASLSNHIFDLWLNSLETVKLTELPLPAIPLAGPIIPLVQLNLVSVDRVVTSSEQRIDVIGVVHSVAKFSESSKTKTIEIKNSRSKKKELFIAVECKLLREQCDEVKKQGVITIIQNAKIETPFGKDKYLVADKSSFIFVVDDNFQESWIPESQRHFIRNLRPNGTRKSIMNPSNRSPLQSSANLNAFSISNGLNTPPPIFSSPPRPVPSTSGINTIPRLLTPSSSSVGWMPRMLNTPPRLTPPSLSSAPPSCNNSSTSTNTPLPRKNLFQSSPQFSLFDVLESTTNSSSDKQTWTIENAKIDQFELSQYDGCPDDSCTKKREGSNLPYTCMGRRCRGSPQKQEVKVRYRSVFYLEDFSTKLEKVKMFDEGTRKLFELLKLNPQSIANDEIKARIQSPTYNVRLNGKRDNYCPWEYTVEQVDLAQTGQQ